MINRGVILWLVVTVALGIGTFVMKHRVQEQEERLGELNRAILEDQEAIHVLRAEWAHLNDPARLSRLNQKFLELQPIAGDQYFAIEQIPFRSSVIESPTEDGSKPQALGPYIHAQPAAQEIRQ
jgi:hypothetical protein